MYEGFAKLASELAQPDTQKKTHYPECRSCSAANLAELQNFHCYPMTVAVYLPQSCLSRIALTILKSQLVVSHCASNEQEDVKVFCKT